VNGNYYIDLKENCNHFNACTIYYFVLNLLLGKSGNDKMSEKMTAFDLVKNGFFKNPHPPENPRIRGLKILLLRTGLRICMQLLRTDGRMDGRTDGRKETVAITDDTRCHCYIIRAPTRP
jgi:hypothetical protein